MAHIYAYHIVRSWADWISTTALSSQLRDHLWIIPTSQSIHIVSLSTVFGSAAMISLRLLGVGAISGRSVSQLVTTLVPWIYRAMFALLLTGLVQTIAEPVRQFVTPAFWWKMLMIVCVLSLTIWFSRSVHVNTSKWDEPATRPVNAKLFGLISLGLWIAIICCGRFIGYTWMSHM